MGKYILVYEVTELDDDGGGIYVERFKEEQDMHNRVNILNSEHPENIMVLAAGHFSAEYKYNPVTYVTKYEPERI